MLKKNDIVKCEITDYSSDGNGVAKIDGLVIFVPDSAVGDICEIKILKNAVRLRFWQNRKNYQSFCRKTAFTLP